MIYVVIRLERDWVIDWANCLPLENARFFPYTHVINRVTQVGENGKKSTKRKQFVILFSRSLQMTKKQQKETSKLAGIRS